MATVTTVEGGRRSATSFLVGARLTTVAWNLFAVVVTLCLWQFADILIASPFFPGPVKVVQAFIRLAVHGDTSGNFPLDVTPGRA